MIKTTLKTMIAAAVVVGTGLGGVAQAATVNDAILGTGVSGTDSVFLNILDSDASLVIDGQTGEIKTTGNIAAGDLIVGSIGIANFNVLSNGGFQPGMGGINELTGAYLLRVNAASASTIETGAASGAEVALVNAVLGTIATSGPSPAFDVVFDNASATEAAAFGGFDASFGFGSGAMVSLFDGTVLNYNNDPDTDFIATTLDLAHAADGDFWLSFGSSATDAWTINDKVGGVADITNIAAVLAHVGTFADVEFALDQIVLGSSIINFAAHSGTPDLVNGGSGANDLIGGSNSAGTTGVVGSDLSFVGSAIVIPIPAAVGPALALLGGLAFVGRFRRRRSEVSFN